MVGQRAWAEVTQDELEAGSRQRSGDQRDEGPPEGNHEDETLQDHGEPRGLNDARNDGGAIAAPQAIPRE